MFAETGLSWGVELAGEHRGKVFDWHLPGAPDQHWVQLELSHQAEAWLLNRGALDPMAFQALVAEGARPRVAEFDEGLLVILRGVNLNAGADPEDMVSVRLWLDRHRLLSVTPRRVQAVLDLRDQLHHGRGPRSPAAVLVAIAGKLLDRVHQFLGELDEKVDELHEQLVQEQLLPFRKGLALLRRRLIQFRRYLAPQRDTLLRLLREHHEWFEPELQEQLREIAERTGKYVDDIHWMTERAAVMHDELESRLNERMNRNMQFMSLVAVMFLPLSFLTSLWSVNTGGVPWKDDPDGFWYVSCMMLMLVFVQLLVLRRRRLFQSL
ncbi:MAG TPA: CorA family divalent cation transporter [Planctomycetota bacterium]|nr:CorA family divalent cation transporter [Planctomycetota bacterium]